MAERSIRTLPAVWYLRPSDAIMSTAAKKHGFSSSQYTPDVIEDLCNIASGGYMRPASDIVQDVKAQIENGFHKISANSFPFRREIFNDSTSTTNRTAAMKQNVEMAIKYNLSVCDFVKNVDLTSVPGVAPVDKAFNALKILSAAQRDVSLVKPINHPNIGGDEMPVFTACSALGAGTGAETVNEALKAAESLDFIERQLLFDKSADTPSDGGGAGPAYDGSGGGTEKRELQKAEIAMTMAKGYKDVLRIGRNLAGLSKMMIGKGRLVRRDPEGTDSRSRKIESINEMTRMRQTEWSLPEMIRLYRIATRVANVTERVSITEKKQLLYMLIDCSGSMSGSKIYAAGGVAMSRLRGVYEGDAELYYRFFDGDVHDEYHVVDKADAQKAMKAVLNYNYSGGSTNIRHALLAGRDQINALESQGLCKPELVIVTDGEDSSVSTLKAADFDGIKLHAFVVGGKNAWLASLVAACNGVCIQNL